MGREQITQNVTPTEAEIQGVYNHNAAVYGPRESRTLQSIVLPTQAAAQAFAQRVRGGADFAAAASAAGFSAGDITFPNQQRAQFATATAGPVADAAFGAVQGAVVGPIQSELGFHVVRVAQVTTTPARALETVRSDIARAIEARKRTDALAALIGRVEDQLSSGANFDEVARAEHLVVITTPALTASGQPGPLPAGQTWTAPPELAPLLRSAFQIDPENLDPAVEQLVPNERFALVGVARVQPAAPPPLAQIRDRVRAAFIQRTALTRAKALADAIVARINAGTPAARAYAEAQPRLPAARPVDVQRIQIMRTDQPAPPPLIALFNTQAGKARVVPAANNEGWYIVFHESSTSGNADSEPTLITRIRTDLLGSASEDFAEQFARAIEARSEVQRNPAAIAAARNQAAGGGPVR
jgi:peptidyl-prolyl cis-trans isomerase D